jgi:hypothetical protein
MSHKVIIKGDNVSKTNNYTEKYKAIKAREGIEKLVNDFSDNGEYLPFNHIRLPEHVNTDVEFFDFRFVKEENQLKYDKKDIFYIALSAITLTDRHLENSLWEKIDSVYSKQKEIIISFDFEKVENLNEDHLFHFLGKFISEFDNAQLIIFNIQTKLIFELKKKNDIYYKLTKKSFSDNSYWGDKAILIYSYVETKAADKDKNKRFYFTDILWGKTEDEFYIINNIVSRTHYNSIRTIMPEKKIEVHDSEIEKIKKQLKKEKCQFFDIKGKEVNLFHFDLLIKDSDSKPLFCHNAETLLQNEIGTKESRNGLYGVEALVDNIESMQAYKIPNSHFRLGSKMHITDFYYAKPFFQNSFFAYKYALLLAYDIIHHSKEFKKVIDNTDTDNEFTLIGYGLYSELLICYVKEFLESYYYYKTLTINTNTVTDAEECKLNKPRTNANPIYSNAIIIVPIATTFSTSIKMKGIVEEEYKKQYEEKIKETEEISECRNKKITIIEPYYNIFSVVDESFTKIDGKVPEDSIFKKFGWEYIHIDRKIVITKTFNKPKEEVEQKYYIYQETKWHDITECEKCFPKENRECEKNHNCLKKCDIREECRLLQEKPLFATDKTSLTPELILEQPIARTIKERRKLILTPTTVKRGHIVREIRHYRYYFNDDELWEQNKKEVKEWLEDKIKVNVEPFDRIVILSPCHFSNAGFVEMVNQIKFNNRATIIHYDPAIENVQNFETFYGNIIGANNIKIYFVDDVVTSGTSFFVANSFLQGICTNKKLEFEACFFVINYAGYYDYKKIINVLSEDKIYSFANLHFPYLIKSIDGQCQLCDETEKKYEKLYDNSCLTRVKLHFLKEKKKLDKTDIYSKDEPDGEEKTYERRKRICKRVEAIHRIYDLFSEEYKNDEKFQNELDENFKKDFRTWVNFLMEQTKNPFVVIDTEKKDEFLMETHSLKPGDTPEEGCLLTETEVSVLKCLTQSPFYEYKKIREYTFRWVLDLLEKKIKKLYDAIDCTDSAEINKKSFSELKLLIHRATLLGSNYIFSYKFLYLLKKLYKAIEDKKSRPDVTEESLRSFSVFFVAQMNELLYKDEAHSKQLNERFRHFERQLNDSDSKFFKQLIRMLLEENTANIRAFAEHFEKSFKGNCETFSELRNHYRTIETQNKSFTTSPSVLYYLQIKLTIKKVQEKDDNIQGKHKIDSIIKERIEPLSKFIKTSKGGCFVIVKYKENDVNPYYLLYNEGEGKRDIEQNEDDYLDNNGFLMKFLNEGENLRNKKSISIIEFHKNKSNNWRDLFANEEAMALNDFPIPKDINRLLLLRIDRDELSDAKKDGKYLPKSKGQAVIGFYFKIDDTDLTKIERIRYLLLLRGDISKYLEKVVEKNDAFKDWVENKIRNRPFLSLTHGIEVYQKTIDHYIKKLNDYRNFIKDETTKNNFIDIINYVDIFSSYLVHKQNLIKNYIELKEGKTTKEFIQKKFKIRNFIDAIYTTDNEKYKYIVHFYNINYTYELEDGAINIVDNITNEDKDIDFDYPESLIDEVIFEIIYNIRKYVIEKYTIISKDDPLQIILEIVKKIDVIYFVISNNKCIYDDENFDIRLNSKLKNSANRDGLNLIYNYLALFFNRTDNLLHIEIDIKQEIFKVWIPVT